MNLQAKHLACITPCLLYIIHALLTVCKQQIFEQLPFNALLTIRMTSEKVAGVPLKAMEDSPLDSDERDFDNEAVPAGLSVPSSRTVWSITSRFPEELAFLFLLTEVLKHSKRGITCM